VGWASFGISGAIELVERNGIAGIASAPREKAALSKLRKKVCELRIERDILKKTRSLLREGERVKAFIAAEKADEGVARSCRALGVSRGL
jgi:hypothetical protein